MMQRPTSSFITIVDFDTVFPTVHTNKQRCQVEVEFAMQPECHFVNMMVPDSAVSRVEGSWGMGGGGLNEVSKCGS